MFEEGEDLDKDQPEEIDSAEDAAPAGKERTWTRMDQRKLIVLKTLARPKSLKKAGTLAKLSQKKVMA